MKERETEIEEYTLEADRIYLVSQSVRKRGRKSDKEKEGDRVIKKKRKRQNENVAIDKDTPIKHDQSRHKFIPVEPRPLARALRNSWMPVSPKDPLSSAYFAFLTLTATIAG